MDSGADVLRAQAVLLKVFLLVGGSQCTEYVRALTASISQWAHYEDVQHPCWQLFANNASAFNEESGEISLAALARDIARGGVRSDCAKVSRTFKLVKAKAEVAEDVGIDLAGGDFGSDEHGRRIKADSPEVKATAAYFSGVIRHVLAGAYRHYGKGCGALDKGKQHLARVTVPMDACSEWFRSVTPLLDAAAKKLQTAVQGFWVAPHVDIWPGAVPVIDWDASDEEDAGAAAGGAGQEPDQNAPLQKRAAGGAGAAAPRKKAKVSDDEFVGRVLAVPAWKFGAVWAAHNFAQPRKAVLIGDCVGVDLKQRWTPYSCAMREDKGYTIQLTAKEVDEFHLLAEAAESAQDTPWMHGREIKE